MNQILLRCYMNNLSSAATNIKHGGILQKENLYNE